MSLIYLEDIVKEYRSRLVLSGASLRVERRERLALTGPNGSGKTTLIRIAMGLESCDSGNVIIGRGVKVGYLSQNLAEVGGDGDAPGETAVHYEKVVRLEMKLRELEQRLEETSGESGPSDSEELLKQYARLQERYEALDGYSAEARIRATLLGLGLKQEALTVPVSSLSGGEQMRVAIARLLLEEPDLLILDEPTNHLDIHASEWLEGFLKKFEGGVLFVSHDRYFLDQVATRVAELENGTIIERSGSYSAFVEQKQRMAEFAEKERKRLELNIRIEEAKALSLKGESRHRTRNISAWKSREKMVSRLREKLDQNNSGFKAQEHLGQKAAPRFRFKSIGHMSAEIAKAEGLEKAYGDRILFSDVSFLIRGGERIGIIGSNGCGKTTLLNILLGKDNEYTGFARLGGWVRYAFLGQKVEFLDEERTILEEFTSRREMDEDFARERLSDFQFYGDDINKKLAILSGGERVRLHLACIMLLDPDCLIMDEPTNHLDIVARNAIMDAIASFKGSLLAVTHDRYFLTRCVNRILEFEDGHLHSYPGNYEAYKQAKEADPDQRQEGMKSRDRRELPGHCGKAGQGSRRTAKTDMSVPAGTTRISIPELESSIFTLEEKKKALEETFGKDTPPDTYSEYDSLVAQLNSLYAAWEGSAENQ